MTKNLRNKLNWFTLTFLTVLLVHSSCQSKTSKRPYSDGNQPLGWYHIDVNLNDIKINSHIDTSNVNTQLALSLIEVIDVKVNFQANGYLRFKDNLGLLSLLDNENYADSVKYFIKDGELILSDRQFDFLENQNIYLNPSEKGFDLLIDSVRVSLTPI